MPGSRDLVLANPRSCRAGVGGKFEGKETYSCATSAPVVLPLLAIFAVTMAMASKGSVEPEPFLSRVKN